MINKKFHVRRAKGPSGGYKQYFLQFFGSTAGIEEMLDRRQEADSCQQRIRPVDFNPSKQLVKVYASNQLLSIDIKTVQISFDMGESWSVAYDWYRGKIGKVDNKKTAHYLEEDQMKIFQKMIWQNIGPRKDRVKV